MLSWRDKINLYKNIFNKDILLRVKPSISLFLWQYLRKFKIKKAGNKFVIHSHLPPINSKAYHHFINDYLVARSKSPTHAQIGITNSCPMNCNFCYSKKRKGKLLSSAAIISLIKELKELGIIWLGLTGGEPLLNSDILKIVENIGDSISSKLFTTGYGLTETLAAALKKAGLDYVSISLDHWREEEYDRIRGCKGAYQTALRAIDIFRRQDLHVSVSAVLTREIINTEQIETFLKFLIELDIDEAWLSEVKPSCRPFWDSTWVINEDERKKLVELQNKYNKRGKITVNYLGHFEGKEHFGCSAGNKMIYIDSCGEVSPCVFTPFSFGNVRERNIVDIYNEMKSYFPTEDSCFINKNYQLIKKYYRGELPLNKEDTIKMMAEVNFGPLSRFFKIYNGEET